METAFTLESVLMAILFGVIIDIIVAIFFLGWKFGKEGIFPLVMTALTLRKALSDIRMVAFNRDRTDYGHFHKHQKTIDTYVSLAEKELTIVGVTLNSGIQYDMLSKTLARLCQREERPVKIVISFLNPEQPALMEAFARNNGNTSAETTEKIRESIRAICKCRSELSQIGKDNFKISVHNAIPFASAILIDDTDPEKGRIQLETKAFRANQRASFGFELMSGGSHPLYKTLRDSYKLLLKEGSEINYSEYLTKE